MSQAKINSENKNKLEDKCNSLLFSEISQLFEKISKAQGSQKIKLLFNKNLKIFLDGQSIYPLLRLILPAFDSERGKYGIKQALIAKTYVSSLYLDKNSEDARRLLNWKDPTKTLDLEPSKQLAGDFGLILEDILKTRVQSDFSKLTIGEVNKILDDLANAISMDEKANIIRLKILNGFNACEQKWIARIIFQDLKIGLRLENVLNAFYATALKRYNECTNLRTVCEEEGISSELFGIKLFTNFSPMLAKGFPHSNTNQIATVESFMENQPFLMDLKLDGERILVHIGPDNSFMLFTRRGNDYSDNYWPVAHSIITSIRKKGGFSCILDGEICAWSNSNKAYLPFGNNLTVAKLEREYGADKEDRVGWHIDLPNWMVFIAFDIVYLEGDNSDEIISQALSECGIVHKQFIAGEISNLPLIVRRKILDKILVPEKDRVEIVPSKLVTSEDITERKAALENYFNEVVGAGKEGLVVKKLLKCYELGETSRSTASWVKMKPEYGDNTEDLDLLILGGYGGEGQSLRGEGISTFLCGVKSENDPGKFYTLTKVGTGYSFQELTELREKLAKIQIPWPSRGVPSHFADWVIAKKDDRPHFYYPPNQSIVLQLKCGEIVDSTSFAAGFTCRFPRVARIRYDKTFNEINTLEDLAAAKQRHRAKLTTTQTQELLTSQSQSQYILSQGFTQNTTQNTSQIISQTLSGDRKGTKKESNKSNRKFHTIDEEFTFKTNLNTIHIVDLSNQFFFKKVFCVLQNDFSINDRKFSREELINLIVNYGGEIVANPSHPQCQIIAGNKRTLQIQNLIDKSERDVLDFKYLVECLDTGRAVPIKGYHYLGMCPATEKLLSTQYDVFGLHLQNETNPTDLKRIFSSMDSHIRQLHKRVISFENSQSSSSKPKKGRRGQSDHLDINDIYTKMTYRKEFAILQDVRHYMPSLLGLPNQPCIDNSWRSLIHSCNLTNEERLPIYHDGNSFYQDNIIIYIDIYVDLGPSELKSTDLREIAHYSPLEEYRIDSAIDSRDLMTLKTCFYRLIARGAIVSGRLHQRVSHILLPDNVSEDRIQRIVDRLRLFRLLDEPSFEKRVVRPRWVEDCLREGRIVEPTTESLVSLEPSK